MSTFCFSVIFYKPTVVYKIWYTAYRGNLRHNNCCLVHLTYIMLPPWEKLEFCNNNFVNQVFTLQLCEPKYPVFHVIICLSLDIATVEICLVRFHYQPEFWNYFSSILKGHISPNTPKPGINFARCCVAAVCRRNGHVSCVANFSVPNFIEKSLFSI